MRALIGARHLLLYRFNSYPISVRALGSIGCSKKNWIDRSRTQSERPHHFSLATVDFSRNGGDFKGFSVSNSGRLYRGLKQLPKAHASSFSTSSNGVAATTNLAGESNNKTVKDSSKRDADHQIANTKILRSLAKQLLMNDSVEFLVRTLLALCLLIGAKG